MIDLPVRSSSLARVKTASAPSPVSSETREAIFRETLVEVIAVGRPGILSLLWSCSRDGGCCRWELGDRNVQPVDKARKHFKGRRCQEKFDDFFFAEFFAQF